MKKKDCYYVNQHSCFMLQYHMVVVTKFRHPAIDDVIKQQLLDYTNNYFKEQKLNLIAINTDVDHMHILFEGYPNMNLSTFVNAYKSASSRFIRKNNADYLKQFYWKDFFWSNSYFIGTVSERTEAIVTHYIQNQGKE